MPGRGARWLSWFLGAALLAAVIPAALHFSEGEGFVRLAERAEPWWLLVISTIAALYVVATELLKKWFYRR